MAQSRSEISKRYYRENKERIAEKKREYRAANRDAILEKQKRHYQENRDQILERKRQYYQDNPEKQLARARARSYDITREQYEQKAADQGGMCAICGNPEEVLHIDHCHDTGKVRGLLCGRCNRGLGLFKDSTCNLHNAIAYLNYHDEEQECCYGPPGTGPHAAAAYADCGDDGLR